MEGAYINMKVIIGNPEYCRENMEEAQINSNLRNGNRELVPCSLFE